MKDTNRSTGQIGVGLAMAAFEETGFAFRAQTESDFGIDAHAELIVDGRATGQLLGLQLKTGQSYFDEATETGFVFRFDEKHRRYWVEHSLPVLVVLCDEDKKALYWERIHEQLVTSTGKDYKVVVPRSQTVDSPQHAALASHVTRVVPASSYSVHRLEDQSHGTAKRYSVDIVLNGASTKADIAAVVRQVTEDHVQRRYYRSHLTEGRWGDADADVVWAFIYARIDDITGRNWVCRSIWIREGLDEASSPHRFAGENIGGLVTVDWADAYLARAQAARDVTMRKEAYLRLATATVSTLRTHMSRFADAYREYLSKTLSEAEFLSRVEHDLEAVRAVYMTSADFGYPPYECRDADEQLQSLLAFADNCALFFSESGRDKWDEESRQFQATRNLADYEDSLRHFEYELEKAR